MSPISRRDGGATQWMEGGCYLVARGYSGYITPCIGGESVVDTGGESIVDNISDMATQINQ
jgi:hypothetical protein